MSSTKRQPLKKRTHVLQFIGVVFLLISFSALLFLYSNTVQSFVVRELMSHLSARVGLEFTIESISIRVGSIEVRNASLYEPGVGPLLELEYGAVEFQVLPLLGGRLDVHHVRLDRPKVYIDREHDPQRSDSRFRVERLQDMFRPEWYEREVRDELFTGGPSVEVGHIQIRSGSVVFDDHEREFHVFDLAVGGASVRYGDGEIRVLPGVFSFELSAGRTIDTHSSHVRYRGGLVHLNNQQLRVGSFELRVGDSLVQGAAGVHYDSVPRDLDSLADIDIELHIFEGELFPSDIGGLVLPWMPTSGPTPALEELNEYAPYRLDLDLAGNASELRLGYGEIRSREGGVIRVRGAAWDMAEADTFRFELEFEGVIPDLGELIDVSSRVAEAPPADDNRTQEDGNEQFEFMRVLAADSRLPRLVLFSGQLEGNSSGLSPHSSVLAGNLELETLHGRVAAHGAVGDSGTVGAHGLWGNPDTLPFELHVSTEDYRIGAYSHEGYSAEKLSFDAYATGNALKLESSEAEATLRITGIRMPETDIGVSTPLDAEFDLHYREHELSLAARVEEDALDFVLNGVLRFQTDEGLVGDGEIQFARVDLTALGLREHDLQLSGDMSWSFMRPAERIGTAALRARDITFRSEENVANVDYLDAHFSSSPGLTQFEIGSEILDLRYEGSIGPLLLAERGMDLLGLHVASFPGISFGMEATPSRVGEMNPGRSSREPSDERVETWFELHDTEVLAGILVPELRSIAPFSAGLVYDGAMSQFQVSGWLPALRYDDIELEDVALNAVLDLESFRGELGLATFRTHAIDRAAPASNADLEIADMHLQFHTDAMRLNSELHAGQIRDEEIGSILLSLDLTDPHRVGAVEFEIVNLRIAALQSILRSDAERVLGVVAGSGELDPTNQLLTFQLNLRDSISDLYLEGRYSRPDDHMSVTLEMPMLEMAYVEGFALGEVEETQGYLSGRAEIEGRLAEPELTGQVVFHDVGFSLPRLGSRFGINGQELQLSNNGVQFDNFTITDAGGVPARLNGRITAEFDQGNHEIDVQVNTRGFRTIDTTRADNPLFYGRVLLDADMRVVGLVTEATLEGNLGLRSGSTVTFVMPEQDAGLDATRGIIRFVDDDLSGLDSVSGSAREATAEPQPLAGGLEVGANVQVDSDTQVTIVVDPASGDQLVLRGGGQFSLAVERSGETSLTGTYTISGGEYQLTFQNIVRRNFQILGGSNVTWVGDPFDAQLNVTAEYNLRTSPASLVGAYLSEQETASYRRALPFQVVLELQGAMSEPEISFQLDMPVAERGALAGTVYNRLQQVNENEAERNRQAFALLVFNQFLGEEFTGFDQGAAVSSGARSSAARLLSRQLNIISARVVPRLDLAFEIESYEEIGEEGPEGRTELQVQLSQQFLDDRVRIELGGQFELEGDRQSDDDVADFAGDIVVEYLITEDGRYRIRGFRRNEYQGPIEGTQATTGVALVYTRRFDRLRDLFRRPQEQTELQLPDPGFEQDRS